MKPFMGNPCMHPHCMRADCEECPDYKPTCFGIRVPKWLGNILFRFEARLCRPRNNKSFYVRQIKPYIYTPMAQGTVDELVAVNGYDWVHEDLEADLRKNIVVEEYSELIFKERFVRVDMF